MVEKRGRYIFSLPPISKFSRHHNSFSLAEKNFYSLNGVVDLRGNCPTNEGSCPIGVIIMRGRYPEGYLSLRVIGRGVVVPGGNCPTG